MQFNFAPVLLPVKHQQQHMPGECLVASTMMALEYLGAVLDYQRLLRFLRIQPSIGTPFSNIRELSKLGVTVTYQQGTLLDLHRCLHSGLPCIVSVRTGQLPYWDNIDTQHAVVVVGMDQQSIYLNDPEFPNAPIQVGFGDFDLAWFEQGEYYAVLAP